MKLGKPTILRVSSWESLGFDEVNIAGSVCSASKKSTERNAYVTNKRVRQASSTAHSQQEQSKVR